MPVQMIVGWGAVFASAFLLYMATVVIRWSRPVTAIDPAFFVFARFVLGFAVVALSMTVQRRSLRPRRFGLIVGRTLSNTVAVFCFYQAVATTTVANANILNMTYPIFVAIFTWLFLREQRDRVTLAMVPFAFSGIWLIISPEGAGWNWNDAWGLASGLTASFAMIYLNLCRKYNDAETTLFYMFGIGLVLIYAGFHDRIFVPDAVGFRYLAMSAAFGVGGQYLLTYGFRFVTAVEGSIISSSRILLAALLGPVILDDPALALPGWIGAVLIFSANVVITVRKGKGWK